MAASLSAAQALAAARSTGHRVVQLTGWSSHNRGNRGTGWGPLNGVMVHHTGSDTSQPVAYANNVLHDGYTGLPGPLCQFGIDAQGTIYMIGWGRANHAGAGDDRVLDMVMKEDPSLMTSEAKPSRRDTDGNSRFYGIEVMYSGGHRMTDDQREATVNLSAALCNAHGWGAASVIGHKEWTNTKWDPGQEYMPTMRRDIAAQQKHPTKTETIKQPTTSGAEMQLSDTVKSKDGVDVGIDEYFRMVLVGKAEAQWAKEAAQANGAAIDELAAKVDALTARIDALIRADVKL